MWTYKDMRDGGAFADLQKFMAWNRCGAISRGYPGVLNDFGSTIDGNAATVSGDEWDLRKNVIPFHVNATSDTRFCRVVVADQDMDDDSWGRWIISGDIDEAIVPCIAVSGAVTTGGILTQASDDDTSPEGVATAGVLTARPMSELDSMTVPVAICGTLVTLSITGAASNCKIRLGNVPISGWGA